MWEGNDSLGFRIFEGYTVVCGDKGNFDILWGRHRLCRRFWSKDRDHGGVNTLSPTDEGWQKPETKGDEQRACRPKHSEGEETEEFPVVSDS